MDGLFLDTHACCIEWRWKSLMLPIKRQVDRCTEYLFTTAFIRLPTHFGTYTGGLYILILTSKYRTAIYHDWYMYMNCRGDKQKYLMPPKSIQLKFPNYMYTLLSELHVRLNNVFKCYKYIATIQNEVIYIQELWTSIFLKTIFGHKNVFVKHYTPDMWPWHTINLT